ncbi:S-adenosyl-L-methionine-dependent methyltransferase [Phyllosticta capitalensis]|uniref:S-adenosyl-L-methionine-dependent methyltransferase n=1 Tax=Phyllosticta capitalensis TaxID=121624 RepID=A0ABR1YSR6_9PEZI
MATVSSRTFHNTSSAYILPNDATEQDRLDLQSSCIKSLLGGRVTLAPLPPKPSKILDVGCGTAHGTLDIARQHPSAQVYGLDITPVSERARSQAPENLHFLEGNVLEVDAAAPPSSSSPLAALQPNTFTHVFSRLLFLGMNDWPGYISRAKALLVPGGYLEIQEMDPYFYDADGKHIEYEFEGTMNGVLEARGLDLRAGMHAAERMRAAGFVDVNVERRRWVIHTLPGEPETDMTRYFSQSTPAMFNLLLEKMVLPQADRFGGEEAVRKWHQSAKECLFDVPGAHSEFFVTVGRKPE